MQVIRDKLRTSLRPDRPYLFFGPSQTGKKTTLARVAKELGLQPRILTSDEVIVLGALPSHSIAGRNAFIIRIDSAELVKTLPGTIVFYTCLDPYSFGASDRVNAKFTLVDLSRVLQASAVPRSLSNGALDTDNLKKPPWVALQEMCKPNSSYDKHLEIVSANPMFCESLHNNLEHNGDLFTVEEITSTLSTLDRNFYIEHSGDHLMLMECMTMIRKLRLSGHAQLNWKRAGQSHRYLRPKADPTKADRFSILGHETGLKKPQGKKREIKPTPGENPEKRPRKLPHCKQCNVPLKGHVCTKKSDTDTKVKEQFIKPS
jgi:hypothetical protein